MKLIFIFLLVSLMLFTPISCFTKGNVTSNYLFPFPIKINNQTFQSKLVIDSNWRWLHHKDNSSINCYPGGWNPQVCPDATTCSNNCAIEGVSQQQWNSTYGITGTNGTVKINFVTGSNVGGRLYLVDEEGDQYVGFNLLNKEFSFDADMGNSGCGLNGAVYFIQMPLNGGHNLECGFAAQYGLGYCDSQCANVKIIDNKANGLNGHYENGACCAEFDIWEANSRSTAMAYHTCNITGLYECTNDVTCGRGSSGDGVCKKGSEDYNPFKSGHHTFYGKGCSYQIDSSQPFTIKTKFITDDGTENGNLVSIQRSYIQSGVTIDGGSLPTTYFQNMSSALKRKMVLSLSLWDDWSSHMLWLDGIWPRGSSNPNDKRGPCGQGEGDPNHIRNAFPNSSVVYSNFRINDL